VSAAITFWPSLYEPAAGRRIATTWGALAQRAVSPRAYASKATLSRWSAATFEGHHRSLARVISVGAAVLDADRGPPAERSEELIRVALAELSGYAHTTWSSAPDNLRWRIVLPLSRAVTVAEYDRVWRAAAEHVGDIVDYCARDAAHAWAVPAQRDGYRCLQFGGELLDVDYAFSRFPAETRSTNENIGETRSVANHERVERARRYLEKMDPAISGSGGHAVLWRAAVALVRGFSLDEETALRLLVSEYNGRCVPPWSFVELRHKVRDAAQRGKLERGWMLAQERR
jgi:hypothetical protein